MIKIICDRCGADITAQDKISIVAIHHRDKITWSIEDMNDEGHYCESCVEKIRKFVTCAPTGSMEQNAEAVPDKKARDSTKNPKARYHKIDYGKIKALHDAGWSNGKIAEEMAMTAQSVANVLYRLRKSDRLQ